MRCLINSFVFSFLVAGMSAQAFASEAIQGSNNAECMLAFQDDHGYKRQDFQFELQLGTFLQREIKFNGKKRFIYLTAPKGKDASVVTQFMTYTNDTGTSAEAMAASIVPMPTTLPYRFVLTHVVPETGGKFYITLDCNNL